MKAYSPDFRSKIIQAYYGGDGSQREIAARFKVSLSFVRDLLKLFRETGSIHPRPTAVHAPKPKIDPASVGLVLQLLSAQPSLSLTQLCERLASERNVRVSRATLWRALARSRKAKPAVTASRSRGRRRNRHVDRSSQSLPPQENLR